MVASLMATSVAKPPKGPSPPRAKSTNAQLSKPIYTRTLKTNTTANANSVYKARSDTSLSNGVRNLSIHSGSAQSTSLAGNTNRRFNSAGQVGKSLEDIARQIVGNHFKNIVVMAGAGISTASGIPDFRSPGTGLYDNLKQYRIPYPQAIFDIDYFRHNPRPFFTLAKELYPSGKYRPNYVHYFLRLLYEKGLLLRVYTQNIDGLERLAGIPPTKLVEAHGSFVSACCVQCKVPCPENDIRGVIFGNKIPRCKKSGCFGVVKPDIVFFGEDLPRRFYYYLRDFPQADLLLVMGTSLEVEPFAGIVDSVRLYVPRVLFNREAVGPFETKRRMNDIVVGGDIVEKIRGFVVQLGWKKELDNLIAENESEYQRNQSKSSTSSREDTISAVNAFTTGGQVRCPVNGLTTAASPESYPGHSTAPKGGASLDQSNTDPTAVSGSVHQSVRVSASGSDKDPTTPRAIYPTARNSICHTAPQPTNPPLPSGVSRGGTTSTSVCFNPGARSLSTQSQTPRACPNVPPTPISMLDTAVIKGANTIRIRDPGLPGDSSVSPRLPFKGTISITSSKPATVFNTCHTSTVKPENIEAGTYQVSGSGPYKSSRQKTGLETIETNTTRHQSHDSKRSSEQLQSEQRKETEQGQKAQKSSGSVPLQGEQVGPATKACVEEGEVVSTTLQPKGHQDVLRSCILGTVEQNQVLSEEPKIHLKVGSLPGSTDVIGTTANRPQTENHTSENKTEIGTSIVHASSRTVNQVSGGTASQNNDSPSQASSKRFVKVRLKQRFKRNKPPQSPLFKRSNKIPFDAQTTRPAIRGTKSVTPTQNTTRNLFINKTPPPQVGFQRPLPTSFRQPNLRPQPITATITKTKFHTSFTQALRFSQRAEERPDELKRGGPQILPRITYRHRMLATENVNGPRVAQWLKHTSCTSYRSTSDSNGSGSPGSDSSNETSDDTD